VNGPKGPKGRDAVSDIEAALEGLLGKLGGTLSEMLGKLETGEAGEMRRSATFDSGRGPVRAETGIRIRVGGKTFDGQPRNVEPVNRPAAPRDVAGPEAPSAGSSGAVRQVVFDTYTAEGRWIASVEVPGLSIDDIILRTDDGELTLETTGPRRFRGVAKLPAGGEADAIETVLRNGIGIRIRFPREAALAALLDDEPALAAERDRLAAAASGASFEAAELGRRVAEALVARRDAAADRLAAALAPMARRLLTKPPEEDVEVLRAEVLLQAGSEDAFAMAALDHASRLGFAGQAEASVRLVGPSPAFHFADLALGQNRNAA